MEGILFHSLYGVMRLDMTMAASGDSVHRTLQRAWYLVLVCTIVLLLTGGLGVAQAGSGANWTQAPAPDFSARNGHTSVVFNGKMWVIGGNDGIKILNDTWSSSDGIHWTQEVVQAQFPARYGHTSVVFNGKMWVIGGYMDDWAGSLGTVNDVWSSSNGILWTPVVSPAAFLPRYGHTSVVFNGKMWVIGGYDPSSFTTFNDVWSSSNGILWTLETNPALALYRWGHTSVVFDDGDGSGEQMWVIGGTDENGNNAADVWNSTDGIKWTNATALPGAVPFSARAGHTSVVYNNGTGDKIWMLGGADLTGNLDEVWYSVDGKAWTDATAVPGAVPFQKRSGHTSVVFNNGTGNKMWVISGIDGVNLPDVSYNPQPSVESIAPSILYNLPDTGIIVTGKYFDKDATVKLHQGATDVVATNVIVNSVTKITFDADLTGKATGSWDVVVTNPDGQTGTLAGGLTVIQALPAPKVTSITPNLLPNNGKFSLTVIGTDFVDGAKVKLTRDGFSGIAATNEQWISAGKITCDFDLRGIVPGDWQVIVTNPDHQTNNLFQMISLTVASAAGNAPQSDTSGSYGTGKSTAPASVVEPGVPGAPASADQGQTATIYANPNGVITQATSLQSTNGLATLTVGLGVVAKDANNNPLSSVSIAAVSAENVPALSGTTLSYSGMTYNLQPDGATFSPAISVGFSTPPGQVGQDYTVKSYDQASRTWQDLPTSYDPATGTVTAQVSHFCLFAVFTKMVPKAPAIASTPVVTPLIPTTIKPPSPTIATTFLGIVLTVINLLVTNPILLAGIAILAVGIVLMVWKQRRDRLYPKT